ncbi:hypothetical protein PRIPAC_96763 [Pristionchus pacificus]|uniref:G protein-coupled receptor n=1 Tax=Pristionchus pacificus TaxID=54126 RepID=A0A2A6B391_PRIPA|nr:hypothetical protein PRIPAC_96763 [Pristionchus pacificus]|eukprot:PDM60349.1 G protein-coupled receptor [Pristionchus pacificus]
MEPLDEPLYQGKRRIIQDNEPSEHDSDRDYQLPLAYEIERAMYGAAIVLGVVASAYTIHKFTRSCKENRCVAARLLSYKISLSVADALILFVYAPTQAVWITTFWWYGGDALCRLYKFITTFAFYLTGNMQVLIAVDRLVTMTHLTEAKDYNARLFLTIAWVLALVPALPKLLNYVKLNYVNGNVDCPQCSSVWNGYSILMEIERAHRAIPSELVDNLTIISSFNTSSIWKEWIRVQELQNVLEMANSSSSASNAILKCDRPRSLGSSPTRDSGLIRTADQEQIHHARLSRSDRCATGTSALAVEDSILASQRRAKYPPPRSAKRPVGAIAPWMRTVDTVRRNAKRKVRANSTFLMLSFNLIFWLPYTFHAIASSFVELNYFQFQFACALVVFNAITNILL